MTAEHFFTFDNDDHEEDDMEDRELKNFKNEWEEKWNPSIGEDLPNLLISGSRSFWTMRRVCATLTLGVMLTICFKMMNPFT